MEYGAIDLHLRNSQIRILAEDESIVLDRRVPTTREGLMQVFGPRARMRILLESSTESEWVAQYLEGLSHEVIVADPNYAPMYGARSRKVKTDKRDVAALALACRRGIYRAAHRASAAARTLRQTMRVRRQLVQMRSGVISLLRSLLRQEGLRLPAGSTEHVLARLDSLTVPDALAAVLAPIRETLTQLNATLAKADRAATARAQADATTRRLMTAPGVGPILGLTFQAVLDDPARFGGDPARASAYLGLVPSEQSSGERQRKGHITKAGSREVRALLVQASWAIWRGRSAAGADLRTWAQLLAARRGRRIAIVGLARRLSRMLYAMWRDETAFTARRRPAAVAPAQA